MPIKSFGNNSKSGNSMMGIGSAVSAGLGMAGNAMSMIGQRQRERRANRQNERMQDRQQKNQMALNQQGHDLSMDLWNKTNVGAQMEHMKEAGLNPALMYGQGGGSGTTANSSGGSASGGGTIQPQSMLDINAMDGMLKMAQIELMKAQGKKADAEADDIGEAKHGKYLDNLIKQVEAWGFQEGEDTTEGHSGTRGAGVAKDSPLYKKMQADSRKAEEELELAKKQNDIAEAEKTIKEFEASMAEEGISSGSPYYVKLLTDLMKKAGIIDWLKE
jgi:hypothetical protein